ncbi:hypothetical protein FQN54_006978 [Arachnomyces sp. PD_36]|nr:hypothetical protein FQN54_006978 [Arachnomyces sp. PD_36]
MSSLEIAKAIAAVVTVCAVVVMAYCRIMNARREERLRGDLRAQMDELARCIDENNAVRIRLTDALETNLASRSFEGSSSTDAAKRFLTAARRKVSGGDGQLMD